MSVGLGDNAKKMMKMKERKRGMENANFDHETFIFWP